MKTSANFITARKRSLGQGNVFTPVYHSVHRGGWLPSMHHRSHDRGEEGQPPRGSPFRGVCIQGGWADSPHGILWDTSGRYASYWNALLFNFSIGDSQIRFIYWIRSFSQIFSGSSFFAHSTTSYEPRCIATIHIWNNVSQKSAFSILAGMQQ